MRTNNKFKNLIDFVNELELDKIQYRYGTAGFRYHHEIIEGISEHIGVIGVVLSYCYNNAIGIMITASHNPKEYNGVKIIDYRGEMLPPELEPTLTKLVNLSNGQFNAFKNHYAQFNDPNITNIPKIFIGMDNRFSSKDIKRGIMTGSIIASKNKVNIIDLGLVTTPELHFGVVLEGINYTEHFCNSFLDFIEGSSNGLNGMNIIVDCANGIGGIKMLEIKDRLRGILDIELVNTNNPDLINDGCGAEFVHKNRVLPKPLNKPTKIKNSLIGCLDGDSDRLVFIFTNGSDIRIIDGDRIGVLFILYIKELIKNLPLDTNLGYIHTGYANGGAIDYIRNVLKIKTKFTKTGVKYLHHVAKKYDIGIYFESNGHGTVLFNKKYLRKISMLNDPDAKKLILFSKLINQFVGDGISNLLGFIGILMCSNIKIESLLDFYDEYPFKLSKVYIKGKDRIKTNDNETRVIEPIGIQNEIDRIIKNNGLNLDSNSDESKSESRVRAFIRPSGTEDCVRLYVEALSSDSNNDNNNENNYIEIISNAIEAYLRSVFNN